MRKEDKLIKQAKEYRNEKRKEFMNDPTTIVNGMGYYCDGVLVNEEYCKGCPYLVLDIERNLACYEEEYNECINK